MSEPFLPISAPNPIAAGARDIADLQRRVEMLEAFIRQLKINPIDGAVMSDNIYAHSQIWRSGQ